MAETPVESRHLASPKEGHIRLIAYARDTDTLVAYQSGSVISDAHSTAVGNHIVNLPNATRGLEFVIISANGFTMEIIRDPGDVFDLNDGDMSYTEDTSLLVLNGSVHIRCDSDNHWNIVGGYGPVQLSNSDEVVYFDGASVIQTGTEGAKFWRPKNADGDDEVGVAGGPADNSRIMGTECRVAAINSLATGAYAKSLMAHGRAFSSGAHGHDALNINQYGACQGEEGHLKAFTDGDGTPSANMSDWEDEEGVPIEENRVYLFEMLLVGKRLDAASQSAMWHTLFGVDGIASPGSTILFENKTVLYQSGDAGNWDYALSIDAGASGGVLQIEVTGDAMMNVGWSVVLRPLEVFGLSPPA